MNKTNRTHFIFYFFIILFFAACSSDNKGNGDIDDDGTYTITYHITPRLGNDVNATNDEMMKTILLFIVDSNNQVESIVDIELPETLQEYRVEVQLTTGQKEVYGFANLSEEMRTAVGLSGISEGDAMPDLSDAVLTLPNNYIIGAATGNWIPMSNQTTYRVTNTSGQAFSLELIRLLCKVSFNFRNQTGYTARLQQVGISPITSSSVYLMPQDGDTPVFPTQPTQDEYTHTFNSTYTFADGGELQYIAYLNESEINGSGWFQIFLVTSDEQGQETVERMALTEISSLKRNDYLYLPIILTDYKLELEVRSYPPIGGYPAVVTEEGDEYHITFAGGGPFVIIPTLIRLSDGLEIEVADESWTFTYTDTTPSFFDVAPMLQDGEITGTIRPSATGEVLFTLSAQIITSEGVTRTLSYRVYISQN